MSLGETNMSEPMRGTWTLPDFPDEIWLGDRLFRKAQWRQPYDGVVEQYREAVARNSAHMKVYANGLWVIDHVDEDNPDLGRPIEHFFNDHPLGKAIKVVGIFALAFAAVGAVASALSDE
ncbi:MAG: hypothetical protein KF696_13950 [Planctomycetes bacterium]|nr:hypothetical protein [Planctomycetota bacterium]MCW8137023.1 hypothetical protein [Planctomycetota bacterium]